MKENPHESTHIGCVMVDGNERFVAVSALKKSVRSLHHHLPNWPQCPKNARRGLGGVSRAAKGADCKSAASRLRKFKSYSPQILGP